MRTGPDGVGREAMVMGDEGAPQGCYVSAVGGGETYGRDLERALDGEVVELVKARAADDTDQRSVLHQFPGHFVGTKRRR